MTRTRRAAAAALAAALAATLTAAQSAPTVAKAAGPVGFAGQFNTAGNTGPTGPDHFPQAYAGATVGDLTGTGEKDVVVAFPDGSVYALAPNLGASTFTQRWAYRTGGAVHTAPSVADLYDNGQLETIVTSEDGDVYVFSPTGGLEPGWPQRAWYGPSHSNNSNFRAEWFGGIAVADLFGNGQKELVGEAWDHYLYAWDIRGNLLPGFPNNMWDTAWTTPALAPLQPGQPKTLDIVVGSDSGGTEPLGNGGGVWAFPPTGCSSPNADASLGTCQVPGYPIHLDQTIWAAPAVASWGGGNAVVTGAGFYYAGKGRYIAAFDGSGQLLSTLTQFTAASVFGSPAIGSLLGTQAIVDTDMNGNLYARNASGALWTQTGVPSDGLSSPAIAPVDNTGGVPQNGVWVAGGSRLDAVAGNGGYDGSATGFNKSWFPLNGGNAQAFATPTVADLGTGALSVLETWSSNISGGNAVYGVTAVAIPNNPTSIPTGSWPTYHGNPQHSGTLTPTAHITSASGATTSPMNVTWTIDSGSVPATRYKLWYRDGGGPWTYYTATGATSMQFYGAVGHSYSFYVSAENQSGYTEQSRTAQATSGVITANTEPSVAMHGVYSVDGYGTIHSHSSPPMNSSIGAVPWNFQIARGIATATTPGLTTYGYIADGYGGIHPFGGAPAVRGVQGAYWPGWDIIRAIAINPCDNTGTSGWILDGYGGLHPFASVATYPAGPPAWMAPENIDSHGAYWGANWGPTHSYAPWDADRALVINECTPDGHGVDGYFMDLYGGLHAFNTIGESTIPQPAQSASTNYWPNWAIARSFVISSRATNVSAAQGYILDGFGGLHPFGGAPNIADSGYWPGWDIARSVVMDPGTAGPAPKGWVIDGYGGTHPFGPSGNLAPYLTDSNLMINQDVIRGVSSS